MTEFLAMIKSLTAKCFLLLASVIIIFANVSFADYRNIHRQVKKWGIELKDFGWDATYAYEYEKADAASAVTRTNELDLTATYSFHKNLSASLDLPLQYIINPDGSSSSGVSDVSLSAAWQFLSRGVYSLALLPGITFPTGNYQAGIGSGRATYSANLSLNCSRGPLALTWNLIYKRNENLTNNRLDIWKFYFSPVAALSQKAKLMFNLGVETNPSLISNQSPIYAAGGLIWQVNQGLTFTPTLKLGLNKPETDVTAYLDFSW